MVKSHMSLRVLALAGGVGGAKLAAGLSHLLGDRLTVLVNTGDDFEHLGLQISPDIDTVMYTLGGIANKETGWGVADEGWNFMGQLESFGGAGWFRIGDRDLATHIVRSERLRRGQSLTKVTVDLCKSLGISSRILPMTDDRVRTVVRSDGKHLDFQTYFVRLKCAPVVQGLFFHGASEARFNPFLRELEGSDEPVALIVCPSNPYLSIDPILSMPGLSNWIRSHTAACIAVSPIANGKAFKGPTAKIMSELGIDPSATKIAEHYRPLVDGFVFDDADRGLQDEISALGLQTLCTRTEMSNDEDRVSLARQCIGFIQNLIERRKE